MDELVGDEERRFLGKDSRGGMSTNLLEMLIPDDVSVIQDNTYLNGLDGKSNNDNVARVDRSERACTSPRCDNDDGPVVEELTARNYSAGSGGSSGRDKMRSLHNNWQRFHKRGEGMVGGVWEDPGSNFFPELVNNRQQSGNENEGLDNVRREEKQPALSNRVLSPGGIRTKMLSQSGFSQFFVKNTLKGKGVIYGGPARDNLAHIRSQMHQKAAMIDSSKETAVRAVDCLTEPSPNVLSVHDGLSLREWLKTGQNKVDKSKCLSIFRQIIDIIDLSHSRGEALQALRPSCFKLMPSNRVLYMGSPVGGKEFHHLENEQDKKRGLEHDLVIGTSQSSKRRKHGDNVNSFRRWPQFAMRSHDSGYGFNEESIPRRDDMYTNYQNMSTSLHTSQMASNSHGDQLEEQWYASPEDPKGKCATLASNVYSLGVLLFELLGSFESARTHAIAMMDLRQRILPPSYLSENPREAGFCLWLLHPEPSLRPTTRDILQSEFVRGIQQSSMEELSSSIEQDDTESDLMLHFLESLKEQKQIVATKVVDDIRCLESDIAEIESRRSGSIQENHPTLAGKQQSYTSASPGGSRLISNMNHLEHAYFSVRSSIGTPGRDTEESEEHEVLRSRENNNLRDKKMEADKKPLDRLGVFFNGLCKYARYSKFEVRGILRNGDFSSMGNVICSLGFDRDEDYIATAGVSKKIKVYDFNALLNDSVDIHYPAVEMSNKSKLSWICWNSYIRNYLASTDYDGVVKIWDAGTGEVVSHHSEHEKRAWSVDFCRVDPMKLASGSDDCSVKLWSMNEKKSLATIKSVANVCKCLAVSYVKFLDSGTLVSASTDNTLKLWDLNKASYDCLSTSSCTLTYKGHTNEKNFVGLSVADGYIACGSETNEVFAYHRSLPMPITSYKFGSIDPITGKETENETNQFVSSVCWRQKSEMVVAANSSGCLKLLQMLVRDLGVIKAHPIACKFLYELKASVDKILLKFSTERPNKRRTRFSFLECRNKMESLISNHPVIEGFQKYTLVVEGMLVYFHKDTARDMQYAIDLTKLWQELVDRASERGLFIGEMELLSGSLVASSCVEFFKKLQQCDRLKLMEFVKLIVAMHIQKGKSMMHVDDHRYCKKVTLLTDEIMEQSCKILQKQIVEFEKDKSMILVEDDMCWFTDEIKERAQKVVEGFRKITYNVAENVVLGRDE
uniref:Protein SPA1-related 2-like isoform X1 n=1 Tax=Tanacetum cinerariifolium TaxID=118510 RepID=A0A6L2KCR5_TANCI|nr:protein SPA1-related 2-like isoform X1 [Tanacetum cinerariifolium]